MRTQFHELLGDLEEQLVAMNEIAIEMLGDALQALRRADAAAAAEVVRRDGDVDRRYTQVQTGVFSAIALQAPVASDLRLLSAMIHVNIHVERMADYATSIARLAERSADLAADAALTQQLVEMGDHAQQVGRTAMRSFTSRDAELAWTLPEQDDAVDTRNRSILHRLVRLAAQDEGRLEWVERVLLIPRSIERFGDHAVDIGEQTIFVVTGTAVELSSNAPARGTDTPDDAA